MILLVTHGQDLGADLVIRHLHAQGADYLRLNTDALGTARHHVGFAAGSAELIWGTRRVPAGDVSAVWYRRFARPQVLEGVNPDYRAFAARELTTVLDAFLEAIPGLHVNRFEADRLAGNRLLQAVRARKIGFPVPETLVTQNEARAREFLRRHGQVVTKAISFGALGGPDGRVAYTSAVSPDADWRGLATGPVLLQQRIPKRREWRVTTVAKQVFSARTRDGAAIDPADWRRSNVADLIFEPSELPGTVKTMVTELTAASGLAFGAHDLIETPHGDFYFLETNPAGQWGWLELNAYLPISAALASLLLGHEER